MPDTAGPELNHAYATSEAQQDVLLLLGRVDANVTSLIERADSMDKRLASVERGQWHVKAAIGAVASFVFKDHVPAFLTSFLAGS